MHATRPDGDPPRSSPWSKGPTGLLAAMLATVDHPEPLPLIAVADLRAPCSMFAYDPSTAEPLTDNP